MPGAGDARRLARPVVLGETLFRFDLARLAGREARTVLAGDVERRRGTRLELPGIEMLAARDAVDVAVFVLVLAGAFGLFLALGEAFLALDHGFRELCQSTAREAKLFLIQLCE